MSSLGEQAARQFEGLAVATARDGLESLRIDCARWPALVEFALAQGFARFIDLTAVDDPARTDRFEIVLTLYSLAERRWLRLATRTGEALASITSLFAAADWYEREVYDLFGVRFQGHPNLVRIVLPDDYASHPLRRDHPLGDEPVEFSVTRESHGA